jgi:hypothetical protein
MHFGTKSYLKNNRYHTVKHPLRVNLTTTPQHIFKICFNVFLNYFNV